VKACKIVEGQADDEACVTKFIEGSNGVETYVKWIFFDEFPPAKK